MLDNREAQLVREAFQHISLQLVGISARFYARLFERAPAVRPLFAEDIGPQTAKLAQTLTYVVSALSSRDELRERLLLLGKSHAKLGAEPAHYALVGEVLTEVLAETLDSRWTPELDAAWGRLLTFVAETMIEGGAGDVVDLPKSA